MQPFMKDCVEAGVDEAGRGPLFGMVYTAAVILDQTFDHSRVKDSKKFTSKKKIKEASDYIKEHAVAWSITYADEKVIDFCGRERLVR
jgi:ribonuclease HII